MNKLNLDYQAVMCGSCVVVVVVSTFILHPRDDLVPSTCNEKPLTQIASARKLIESA